MRRLVEWLFHLACVFNYHKPVDYDHRSFQRRLAASAAFFSRFDGHVDFRGKRVLDVGSGRGNTCFHMALNGAASVTGVDINERRIEFAKSRLKDEYPQFIGIVNFLLIDHIKELSGLKFDLIISKDSFEHIEDPDGYIEILSKLIHHDGRIAIGFGPLWKSPYGGHILYMTKLPWAHLIFPESIIAKERKRFRPNLTSDENSVDYWVNKITLRKFNEIIAKNNLQALLFKTNVSNRRISRIMTLLSNLPYLREFFTFNVYGVWALSSETPQPQALREPAAAVRAQLR
jgi:SAM-dependent methyltransferase